ncbi:CRAL-TRIO domain-containing protein [Fennellomyces sp. T-0311]|nr:CRAL-TRIO domain-containing protein [Fennellomyces sp. T-0311]
MTQNKFVEKFTSQEKEAVIQLKEKLPEILKTGLKSDEPYTLWGVALDKDSKDERLDVLLVKFLRARDLNLELASKMLSDSIGWRKEFKADGILDEEFDEDVFGSVGYLHKEDKDGRPVCYNFYGELDQEKVFGDVQKFIRWRVQLMEKGVKLVDLVNVDAMVQVHDYKGASMFGRTANSKQATKEIIKLMQDNYPEFLSTKFFVNVPWWGSKIFKLIRPLLPEATVKKFVVCSNDELIETLSQSIDVENLPLVYRQTTKDAGSDVAVKSEHRTVDTEEAPTPPATADAPEPKQTIEEVATPESGSRKAEKQPAVAAGKQEEAAA